MTMECVLCVGQGCGGTSSAAGVVHKLGFPMYLEGHSGKHPEWDADLYEDKCLYGVFYRMTPDGVEHVRKVVRTHRRERYGFKNTMLGQALPWVVPIVREFDDEVKVVSVHRTLVSCVEGRMAGRCCVPFGKQYSREEAEAWALEARVSLLKGLQTVKDWSVPVLHVSYEHLLSQPEVEVGRVATFLGVDVTGEAVAHVRPDMAHY